MNNGIPSPSGSSIALLTACILGVAGAVLFQRQGANGAGGVRAIESIAAHDARNTFGPAGEFKQEGRPARIFIVKKGDAGGVIEGFNAANNDKLRIEGFGLTRPEAVKALMQQQNRDTVLMLPSGTSIRLAGVPIDSLPDASLQLELDRTGLVETFADGFDRFSWYAEGLAPEQDRQGTWRTNYGWQKPDAEGSRSLPGESEIYADAAFKGTSPDVLGLNPFHLVNGTLEIWASRPPTASSPSSGDGATSQASSPRSIASRSSMACLK